NHLFSEKPESNKKSNQEAYCTHRSKKMHGPLRKLANKEYRDQIQKTINKPAHSKFRCTVFTGVVLDHLLSYLPKTSPFGYHRNISMHFTIHLNGFYDVFSISF